MNQLGSILDQCWTNLVHLFDVRAGSLQSKSDSRSLDLAAATDEEAIDWWVLLSALRDQRDDMLVG